MCQISTLGFFELQPPEHCCWRGRDLILFLCVFHLRTLVMRQVVTTRAVPHKFQIPFIRQFVNLSASNINRILASIKNGTFDTTPYDKNRILPPFHRFMEKFEARVSLLIRTSEYLSAPIRLRYPSSTVWVCALCQKQCVHLEQRYSASSIILQNSKPMDEQSALRNGQPGLAYYFQSF